MEMHKHFAGSALRPFHWTGAKFSKWRSWPGQFVQVGEDSLWDAFDEVVVQAEGVDADQQGDGVPGNIHQVVVAQVQVLQGLQEVLGGVRDGEESKAEITPQRRKRYPHVLKWRLTSVKPRN